MFASNQTRLAFLIAVASVVATVAGSEPGAPEWTSTYAEIEIQPSATYTFTYEEDELATTTTFVWTSSPTASGKTGMIVSCVLDQYHSGNCAEEIWISGVNSGETGTISYTAYGSTPPINTYYEYFPGTYTAAAPTAAPTAQVASASSSKSKLHKVIIPAVVGAVGGLLFLTFGVMFLLRQLNIIRLERKRKQNTVAMARLGARPAGTAEYGEFIGDHKFPVPTRFAADVKVAPVEVEVV